MLYICMCIYNNKKKETIVNHPMRVRTCMRVRIMRVNSKNEISLGE